MQQTYSAVLNAIQATRVLLDGYFFRVDFGPEVHPRYHHVDKQLRCTCSPGAGDAGQRRCPAVLAVIEYLADGGPEPPDPPPGYYPTAPLACPVCGASTVFDLALSSRSRGAGWRCTQAGRSHYWQAHTTALRAKLNANPWLFPPVVVREGVQMIAWDGVQAGDDVLYAGVLRSEIVTAACW